MPRESHPTNSAPAVVIADTGAVSSHAQLAERAASLHALLLEIGLVPGDTVALLSPHRLEVFEVERATRRAGMHVVAIDPIWTIEEAAYVVNDSGARVIFVSSDEVTRAVELSPLTPYVDTRFCFDGSTPGHEAYAEALTAAREHPEPTPTETRLFYSAGALGRPYGVRRPGLLASALSGTVVLGPDTCLLIASPLSDGIAAQLYSAVLDAKGTLVTFARFDPVSAQAAFSDHRPTMAHVLPMHLLQVMKAGLHEDVSQLDSIVLSSAPCPPEAKRWLIEAVGPGVIEVYGCTERDVIATILAEDWLLRPGSVGRPANGTASVLAPDGQEAPPGEPGVLRFWGEDGWSAVGGLGWVDDEGYVYPRGDVRSALRMSTGLVFARDFEDVLAIHGKVADVAVVLVPDGQQGLEVRALVVPQDGVRPGQGLERELITFARGRRRTGPPVHRVDFVESLPRSASGRLIRRRLDRRFVLSDGLMV